MSAEIQLPLRGIVTDLRFSIRLRCQNSPCEQGAAMLDLWRNVRSPFDQETDFPNTGFTERKRKHGVSVLICSSHSGIHISPAINQRPKGIDIRFGTQARHHQRRMPALLLIKIRRRVISWYCC